MLKNYFTKRSKPALLNYTKVGPHVPAARASDLATTDGIKRLEAFPDCVRYLNDPTILLIFGEFSLFQAMQIYLFTLLYY